MPCGKFRKSPDEYTSHTPLPGKKSSPSYQAETDGGKESNANPGAVTEHNKYNTAKNVTISESGDPLQGNTSLNPSIPADVDKFGGK